MKQDKTNGSIHYIYTTFFLLLLLFGLQPTAQAQQLSVEAPSTADINGYFHLKYKVATTSASGFQAPALSDFIILSGPNVAQSSNYKMINGRTTNNESTTYTFILQPRRKGTLTIGSASVQVGGKTLHSRSVTINVTGTPGKSQTANAASNRSASSAQVTADGPINSRDLFITVTPSRRRVFRQEAILLTYRVHSAVGISLQNVMMSSKPDFKGWVSQEIPHSTVQTSLERINGKSYRTGIILQYLVFPQQEGKLTIPGINFTCTVVRRSVDYSDPIEAFFNGGGEVGVQVQRSSAPTIVTVDPLPQPQPAAFSGGVGRFSISGQLLTKDLKTNDIATYRVIIKGNGNLKLITPPSVVFPKDFDTFTPKTTQDVKVGVDGTSGQIVFDYTFVPHNVGKYTLPAVQFVYFNPSSGKYETLRTAAMLLSIGKGRHSSADVQRELALRNSDIHPLLPSEPTFDAAHPFWWGSWTYFAAYLLLLLAAASAYILIQRKVVRNADKVGRRQSKAGKAAKRQLKQAYQLLAQQQEKPFYEALNNTLQTYLAAKFNISTVDLSLDAVKAALAARQIAPDTIQAVADTWSACEYARFAPAANDMQKNDLYRQVAQIIDRVEAAFQSGSRKGKLPPLPLLLLLLTLMGALHSLSLSAAPSTQAEGETLYAKQDYIGAVAAFEHTAKANPSAASYYNLGNAYYRTKNLPQAILYYERALRLSPTNADIRHNLAVARAHLPAHDNMQSEMFLISWMKALMRFFTADAWAHISLFMFILALLGGLLFRFSGRVIGRKVGFTTLLVGLLLTICCNVFAWRATRAYFDEQKAVVMRPTTVFISPDGASKQAGQLNEGTTVTITDKTTQWWRVRLPDGREVWAQSATMEQV